MSSLDRPTSPQMSARPLHLWMRGFPRLTEPESFGLYMEPADSASLDFDIPVPANIEPSNYLGNCFLLQADDFDGVGETLHRTIFVFEVT